MVVNCVSFPHKSYPATLNSGKGDLLTKNIFSKVCFILGIDECIDREVQHAFDRVHHALPGKQAFGRKALMSNTTADRSLVMQTIFA